MHSKTIEKGAHLTHWNKTVLKQKKNEEEKKVNKIVPSVDIIC